MSRSWKAGVRSQGIKGQGYETFVRVYIDEGIIGNSSANFGFAM